MSTLSVACACLCADELIGRRGRAVPIAGRPGRHQRCLRLCQRAHRGLARNFGRMKPPAFTARLHPAMTRQRRRLLWVTDHVQLGPAALVTGGAGQHVSEAHGMLVRDWRYALVQKPLKGGQVRGWSMVLQAVVVVPLQALVPCPVPVYPLATAGTPESRVF